MKEYIDKEALLEIVGKMPLSWEYGKAVSDIYDIIKDHPAADVVEVVRCKDCVYGTLCENMAGADYVDCGMDDQATRLPHDFCSYGERRTDHD